MLGNLSVYSGSLRVLVGRLYSGGPVNSFVRFLQHGRVLNRELAIAGVLTIHESSSQ